MNEKTAAKSLSALGHEARLSVYRLLVRAGDGGLNVGEIGQHLTIPASTLAHHLSALVEVGLVRQQRHGREIRNHANYDAMTDLVDFLTRECCVGVTAPATAP
ncbi:MAG: metalloregulator ArsR/SmtB family transcription factor [Rhizobiaceae bacterium]|nr:metalloregulator ArsR/SmtB family transcription factor [Rhizobiaceae bacterium]|tara:strand:- start:55448 stop:55756 length:309 start_codon:yes stop_codon:yes gene_type:complete